MGVDSVGHPKSDKMPTIVFCDKDHSFDKLSTIAQATSACNAKEERCWKQSDNTTTSATTTTTTTSCLIPNLELTFQSLETKVLQLTKQLEARSCTLNCIEQSPPSKNEHLNKTECHLQVHKITRNDISKVSPLGVHSTASVDHEKEAGDITRENSLGEMISFLENRIVQMKRGNNKGEPSLENHIFLMKGVGNKGETSIENKIDQMKRGSNKRDFFPNVERELREKLLMQRIKEAEARELNMRDELSSSRSIQVSLQSEIGDLKKQLLFATQSEERGGLQRKRESKNASTTTDDNKDTNDVLDKKKHKNNQLIGGKDAAIQTGSNNNPLKLKLLGLQKEVITLRRNQDSFRKSVEKETIAIKNIIEDKCILLKSLVKEEIRTLGENASTILQASSEIKKLQRRLDKVTAENKELRKGDKEKIAIASQNQEECCSSKTLQIPPLGNRSKNDTGDTLISVSSPTTNTAIPFPSVASWNGFTGKIMEAIHADHFPCLPNLGISAKSAKKKRQKKNMKRKSLLRAERKTMRSSCLEKSDSHNSKRILAVKEVHTPSDHNIKRCGALANALDFLSTFFSRSHPNKKYLSCVAASSNVKQTLFSNPVDEGLGEYFDAQS
eukprot:CAMPEP_0194396658 /NCGR_PEP_ID=MMETSP0174-20130528/125113_1 /TAXON_ID=216777 /ORGANISM="Proboscia alata, Strain PI-D3" /LENGTH=613 /DNA_ID=CAMNT_0039192753 /DNA_START=972 /DNA_END=2813 /DNA_ORIENTATION=-